MKKIKEKEPYYWVTHFRAKWALRWDSRLSSPNTLARSTSGWRRSPDLGQTPRYHFRAVSWGFRVLVCSWMHHLGEHEQRSLFDPNVQGFFTIPIANGSFHHRRRSSTGNDLFASSRVVVQVFVKRSVRFRHVINCSSLDRHKLHIHVSALIELKPRSKLSILYS